MRIEKKGRKLLMQHTQEKEFKNKLHLTEEEKTLIETNITQYHLVTSDEAEQKMIPFQLKWAYSVAFDDSMQFELRFGLANDNQAFLIADWYRDGVFYQEEVLTTNPIGKTFYLELPADSTTTLTYETTIDVISSMTSEEK